MSEVKTEEQVGIQAPTRRTRRIIVSVTLAYCYATIGLILVFGSQDNSLHQSALSWAFSLSMFVIAGYIFGAVFDNKSMITWNQKN